jgi:hypothetical protein
MTWRSGVKSQAPARLWLALAGRVQQPQPGLGEGGLEVTAVVVLVPDDDLPNPAEVRLSAAITPRLLRHLRFGMIPA